MSPVGLRAADVISLERDNHILVLNRHEVNGHGEDGNELQTTPEFRAHVAKKLGAMLDRYWHAVPKDPMGVNYTHAVVC